MIHKMSSTKGRRGEGKGGRGWEEGSGRGKEEEGGSRREEEVSPEAGQSFLVSFFEQADRSCAPVPPLQV